MLKRVACVAQICSSTCSKGIRSKPCVDLGNYNWLPNYVAKRVLKIKGWFNMGKSMSVKVACCK